MKRTGAEAPLEGEPVYTRDELLSAAASFDVTPEVVAGALRLADREVLTRSEAQAAIHKFCTRKV